MQRMVPTFLFKLRSGAGRPLTIHGRGCFNHLRFSITPVRVHRLRRERGKKLRTIFPSAVSLAQGGRRNTALYAFGVNSTILWDRTKLPPPRILRTTDGINWAPVPQTPGTFLGDLPFNPDHSSFRSPVSYNGKMFVLSGPVFGQGSLIASANPQQGDNAWFLAAPAGQLFYELAVFNGWLYIGGFDPTNGYTIFKTKAEGPPPYTLTPVVPQALT